MKCYFCGRELGETRGSNYWRMWYFTNDLEHDYDYLKYSKSCVCEQDVTRSESVFRCIIMCRYKDVDIHFDIAKEKIGDICEKINSLMELSFYHWNWE